MLMLAADSDDRVDPMHARKFTAAIQAGSASGEPAIMRIEAKAGHGGAGTRKSAVAQQVDMFAFLLAELGT
jgi:prolyl oligopeptidase